MAHFDACTLCLPTIRTGWPTAEIQFFINRAPDGERHYKEILDKVASISAIEGTDIFLVNQHHAEWIRDCVMDAHDCVPHRRDPSGTLVLIDADTVWWKNCETWEFPDSTLLAGYYMPKIWNDFSKCVSEARIHTSCMVFPSIPRLVEAIVRAYPWAHKEHGDYCPCDPFMPATRFVDGAPRFWDSCANLYQMLLSLSFNQSLDKQLLYHFDDEELFCYDHLNSASFYDVMMARLDNNSGFAKAHDVWVKNPVPGLWPIVNQYYADKAMQAKIECPK